MIKLKRRQVAVESELEEMQGRRYSELSMQFAEVEGERQKLKMGVNFVGCFHWVSFISF